MMGHHKREMIKIGTSGFSFPDWKGPVYPEGIREKDMLPFYEKELGFNVLEVNFTYYTLPSQKSLAGMAQKTSGGFEFVVKSFKGMTHEIRDKETGTWVDNKETFKKFKYGLVPLIEERRLACVLAQFPYGFFPNRENSSYLERFKEEMENIPLVLEFRNRAWLKEETFQFLEKKEIGFCVVDEPKLPQLMPYHPRATSEIGYFRFHGRNPNWFNVPAKVRYDYLYPLAADLETRQVLAIPAADEALDPIAGLPRGRRACAQATRALLERFQVLLQPLDRLAPRQRVLLRLGELLYQPLRLLDDACREPLGRHRPSVLSSELRSSTRFL